MPPLGENYREYKESPAYWENHALGVPLLAGPWDDEPDKAQWIDPATGLDCLIVRNHFRSLCGYVGVPPGHPLHGKKYDDPDVGVHGGLTFADRCDPSHDEAHAICHVPAPGRPDDVYWFGFDCGHAFDLQPIIAARMHRTHDSAFKEQYKTLFPDEIYRDWAYVVGEVTDLARQLKGE